MSTGHRSATRTALVVLIAALSVVLVVLAVNLLPQLVDLAAGRPGATAGVVRQEATADVPLVEAHGRAESRAVDWSEDAVLVRVEANWYVTADWRATTLPPLAWGFLFFSPSEGTLATVVVDDTELLWVPPAAIPVVPAAIETFPPAYAPDLAWVTFLAAGGETFIQDHPQAQVTFRLWPGDAGLMWTVSAFQEEAHVEATLDAHSGIVTIDGGN